LASNWNESKYDCPETSNTGMAVQYECKELIRRTGGKTDCNNYCGISLLSTSYNILSNVLFSRLSPYIDEITGDHQCGFRCNRSITSQIFCIRQILEKKWEYNETVHQLFIDFRNAYDSVRREVLYNIFIEFGIAMKLVRLIKMCLNETYSKIHIDVDVVFLSKMV
jgi:hypothetical protein